LTAAGERLKFSSLTAAIFLAATATPDRLQNIKPKSILHIFLSSADKNLFEKLAKKRLKR